MTRIIDILGAPEADIMQAMELLRVIERVPGEEFVRINPAKAAAVVTLLRGMGALKVDDSESVAQMRRYASKFETVDMDEARALAARLRAGGN